MSGAAPLPEGSKERLDTPEGQIWVGYSFQLPLTEAPPWRTPLVEDKTPAGSLFRIDLDERWHAYFVRRAPGGKPVEAGVDISSLRGGQRFKFYCSWSPLGLKLIVEDRDRPEDYVESH